MKQSFVHATIATFFFTCHLHMNCISSVGRPTFDIHVIGCWSALYPLLTSSPETLTFASQSCLLNFNSPFLRLTFSFPYNIRIKRAKSRFTNQINKSGYFHRVIIAFLLLLVVTHRFLPKKKITYHNISYSFSTVFHQKK